MSDTFEADVEAMFQQVEDDLWGIGRQFILVVAKTAIQWTYGPGYQWPLTLYDATGRLRSGWHWRPQPVDVASIPEDAPGPFPPDGSGALANIDTQLPARPPGISYLENDVTYGFQIVEGLGNHRKIGRRPFNDDGARQSRAAVLSIPGVSAR